MDKHSEIAWILVVVLGVSLYNAKDDVNAAKESYKHSLSRGQFEESNLVNASQKIDQMLRQTNQICYPNSYSRLDGLCGLKQDVDSALVDIRAELADMHKKLDK